MRDGNGEVPDSLVNYVIGRRNEGATINQIVHETGLTVHYVRGVLGLNTTSTKKPATKDEKIPRDCSGCGKRFIAPTRFIRFCKECKSTREWKHGVDMEPHPVGRR